MLCPIHSPQLQSAADVARQHEYARHNQQRNAHNLAHYAANPDFDPALLKPVAIHPMPPMSAVERQQLESELGCLVRERDATQRGIDHILEKLAA